MTMHGELTKESSIVCRSAFGAKDFVRECKAVARAYATISGTVAQRMMIGRASDQSG